MTVQQSGMQQQHTSQPPMSQSRHFVLPGAVPAGLMMELVAEPGRTESTGPEVDSETMMLVGVCEKAGCRVTSQWRPTRLISMQKTHLEMELRSETCMYWMLHTEAQTGSMGAQSKSKRQEVHVAFKYPTRGSRDSRTGTNSLKPADWLKNPGWKDRDSRFGGSCVNTQPSHSNSEYHDSRSDSKYIDNDI